jgi:nickel/cobalt transporter (NicO) family protein
MPIGAAAGAAAPAGGRSQLPARIALALAAVAIVAAGLSLLIWLLAPAAPPPRLPARAPFGMGMREAAPAASGLGAYILALQSSFFRSLQGAVAALKESGAALWSLMAVGFAYGVFHAAGPGHGKAVIAAYLVASERALLKGVLLSLAAALLQALVAITIVGVTAMALRATAATMSQVTSTVEIVSFTAVSVLGAALTWRKAGKLLGVIALACGAGTPAPGCDHVHLPPPVEIDRLTRWREMATVGTGALSRSSTLSGYSALWRLLIHMD